MPTHAILVVTVERPCRRKYCRKPTRYRAAYHYEDQTGGATPYCLEHLVPFATTHHLELPKEAINA